jgi:pimeloyl-ACP methyl ester carboxylesterase
MTSSEFGRVEVRGQSIAYRRVGAGPALVLLHGFLCDSRAWQPQLDGLSDALTVIAWDAPGAGVSSDPPQPFAAADWARCLADFLSAIHVESGNVLGLSWGGLIAQEFYRLYPRRVQRLVLAGTYAGWRGSLPAAECQKRLERCMREASLSSEEVARRWVPEFFTEVASEELLAEMSAIVSAFHPEGFRQMAKSLAEEDTTDLLPTIEVPTLLLWGDDDRRSPIGIATQFHDAIPNAELAVLAHAGHVSNMEQPEGFNAEVHRFCGVGAVP